MAALIALLLPILYLIANYILGMILYFSGWLFDTALKLSTGAKTASLVTTGWEVSLQFANMFFIILFLAMAISTILGSQTSFHYKKALPNLLIVAFLINFSMVIGGLILDASNVFALYFSNTITGGGQDFSAALMNGLNVTTVKHIDRSLLDSLANVVLDFGDVFMSSILQIIIQLLAIFVMLAGVVYMFSRTFWIWLLLMLAPLAWIALAFPAGTKIHSQWNKWWEKFMCWCFFAPVYLFFTYLAFVTGSKAEVFRNAVGDHNFIGLLSPTALIQITIFGFIMLAGTFLSGIIGCGGSNFVLGWGKNLKGASSKRFKELRSKGPLSAEELGKRFGTFGARTVAGIPIAGRIAGYGKVQEKLEKERLDKARESNEAKIKNEKAKLASIDHTDAYAQYQAAIARGDASPQVAALAQIVKEQERLMAMEFKIAEAAARAAAAAAGVPPPATITITTPSGATVTAPIDAKDRGHDTVRRNENIRRTVQNSTAGTHSGVTYI